MHLAEESIIYVAYNIDGFMSLHLNHGGHISPLIFLYISYILATNVCLRYTLYLRRYYLTCSWAVDYIISDEASTTL